MRSETKIKRFALFLILSFSATLTVSAQTEDSIKFSPAEAKVLISAWKSVPKYEEILDSCESESKEYLSVIKADSVEKAAADNIIETQNQLIGSYEKRTDELNKEIRKADRRTKVITGGAILEFIVIIYQLIKS